MGKFIVIDGLDGCGKQTQVELVRQRLTDLGYKVVEIDFPKYESESSAAVRMYLKGEIVSNPNDLNPYICSLFYAVDRGIQFYKEFKKYYDDGYVILADRYLSANIIYQTSKLNTVDEKIEFFKWVYDVETNKVGIPVEDITIALTLPIEISQKLMSRRYNGDESSKDIHESNLEFLKNCSKTLDLACQELPNLGYNWVRVDCSSEDNWIKSREEITEILMALIMPIIENEQS